MRFNNKTKDAVKSKVVRFYISVTVAAIIMAGIYLYSDIVEMRKLMIERAQIQELIRIEEQKQITLSSQKYYFESDSYIEKIAREKLGMVKPGDVVFIDRNSN